MRERRMEEANGSRVREGAKVEEKRMIGEGKGEANARERERDKEGRRKG
jgi:hypothetical protein